MLFGYLWILIMFTVFNFIQVLHLNTFNIGLNFSANYTQVI